MIDIVGFWLIIVKANLYTLVIHWEMFKLKFTLKFHQSESISKISLRYICIHARAYGHTHKDEHARDHEWLPERAHTRNSFKEINVMFCYQKTHRHVFFIVYPFSGLNTYRDLIYHEHEYWCCCHSRNIYLDYPLSCTSIPCTLQMRKQKASL